MVEAASQPAHHGVAPQRGRDPDRSLGDGRLGARDGLVQEPFQSRGREPLEGSQRRRRGQGSAALDGREEGPDDRIVPHAAHVAQRGRRGRAERVVLGPEGGDQGLDADGDPAGVPNATEHPGRRLAHPGVVVHERERRHGRRPGVGDLGEGQDHRGPMTGAVAREARLELVEDLGPEGPRGQARDPRALVLEGGLLEGLGDRLGLALEERLQRRDRRGSGALVPEGHPDQPLDVADDGVRGQGPQRYRPERGVFAPRGLAHRRQGRVPQVGGSLGGGQRGRQVQRAGLRQPDRVPGHLEQRQDRPLAPALQGHQGLGEELVASRQGGDLGQALFVLEHDQQVGRGAAARGLALDDEATELGPDALEAGPKGRVADRVGQVGEGFREARHRGRAARAPQESHQRLYGLLRARPPEERDRRAPNDAIVDEGRQDVIGDPGAELAETVEGRQPAEGVVRVQYREQGMLRVRTAEMGERADRRRGEVRVVDAHERDEHLHRLAVARRPQGLDEELGGGPGTDPSERRFEQRPRRGAPGGQDLQGGVPEAHVLALGDGVDQRRLELASAGPGGPRERELQRLATDAPLGVPEGSEQERARALGPRGLVLAQSFHHGAALLHFVAGVEPLELVEGGDPAGVAHEAPSRESGRSSAAVTSVRISGSRTKTSMES